MSLGLFRGLVALFGALYLAIAIYASQGLPVMRAMETTIVEAVLSLFLFTGSLLGAAYCARMHGRETPIPPFTRERLVVRQAVLRVGIPLALACSPLIVPFVHAIVTGNGESIVVFGVFLMLFGLLVLFQPEFRTVRAPLILDAEGLDHVRLGRVPWSDVVAIDFSIRHGSWMMKLPQLDLLLASPSPRGARVTPVLRREEADGRTVRYNHQRIPLHLLAGSAAAIYAAALSLRDRAGPPRRRAWHSRMTPDEIDRMLSEPVGARPRPEPVHGWHPGASEAELASERRSTVLLLAIGVGAAWLLASRLTTALGG